MKFKIFYPILLITLLLGAYFLISNRSEEGEQISSNETTEVVYFVPVTNYFSELTDVKKEDLEKSGIVTLREDEEYLPEYINKETVIAEDDFGVQGDKIAVIRWDRVTPNLKTLSFEGKYLWDKDDVVKYQLYSSVNLPESEVEALRFKPEKLVKINFVGDVMLSRTVGRQISNYGYNYPWEKTKKIIADADVTFANLEVPISDIYPSPMSGMSFIAPEENLKYIKEAGIDVVSVANNHSANFGYNVFLDNLKNLKAAGIEVCGGGKTEKEARTATVMEAGNNSFGFLCQSAITGSLYADDDSAGVPYLGIEPWYRDSEASIGDLMDDIVRAEKVADTVIVSPHWGVEYKHYPNDSQELVGRKAIETGAEMVVGTHPHVVQSLEYYQGKYIDYSLGNFIFDQEWSQATKEGVMLSGYFYNGQNVSSILTPLVISNYAQPAFVKNSAAASILATIKEYSLGFN
ncbi:MAG: CapA family protein [Patescibacteria group bacterium]|nr:CapA family protein [Patescibacteria group bacterium]